MSAIRDRETAVQLFRCLFRHHPPHQELSATAMKANQSSWTAQIMATLRAMHQHRPSERRVLADPFAERFVTRPIVRRAIRSRVLQRLIDWWNPAWIDQASLRDRFADDVARSMQPPPQQVVALGAGLDTVVARLLPELPQTLFFEVDFPATQAYKRTLLESSGGSWSDNRCQFVSTDFESTSLASALSTSGFRPELRTFVNWMGVTYYLTEDALHHAFQSLQDLLAPHSTVALDYPTPGGVMFDNRRLRRMTTRASEPLLNLLTADNLEAMASRYGFVVDRTLSTEDFARTLHPVNGPWRPSLHFASLRRSG